MGDLRLLLLEFHFPDRYSQFRTRNFPFLLGQAKELGVTTTWLTCHMPPGQDSSERYVIRLDEAARAELLEAIGRFDPTHALVAERLEPDLERTLQAQQPRTLFEDLTAASPDRIMAWPAAWLPEWLGLPGGGPGGFLVDEAAPAYACQSVCQDRAQPAAPVHACGGVDCLYRRPLARNQAFEEVELPAEVRPFGCSFCIGPRQVDHPFQTSAVELAARQCVAAMNCAQTCLARDRYVISGGRVFMGIQAFFDEILRHPFPPSRFFFGCRIDEFVSRAAQIETLLPRLAPHGHTINVFNMGIENFSQAENQRLNKGLSIEVIERGANILRRMESDHPETFQFSQWGGFGLILFTPWTTPADLLTNLDRMEGGMGIDSQGFALTSKLQILSESAIRYLAERDGLLANSFDGFHHYDSGCIYRHDQRELPWRFAHPAVAALYEIAWRIEPLGDPPEAEPLYKRVQTLFQRSKASGGGALAFFRKALKVADALVSPASPEAILDGLEASLPSEPLPTALEPDADRQPEQSQPEPDHQQTPASLHALVVLQALAAGDHLAGFSPQFVYAKDNEGTGPEVVVELKCGPENLILHLLQRRQGIPAFLQTHRFLLRYNEDTPLDTDEKGRVAWLVAANLEEFGLDLTAKSGSAGAGPLEPVLEEDRIASLVAPARGKETPEE